MSLDLQRIQGLCFDVDGTLSDTDDRLVYSLATKFGWISHLSSHANPTQLARRLAMGIESPANVVYGLADRIGIDHGFINLRHHLANFLFQKELGVHPSSFWLIPHVRQTLEKLAPHYKMTIVSARDPYSTQTFLNQFELSPFFIAVAHAQTCKHTKPYPDPILWAAQKMNVTPDRCLMIGDTGVDIRAGKAAGAQTVGVLCGFGEKTELLHAGADQILPSTIDLESILCL